MALLILIDEHISPSVALRLQRDGHWGVASVRDRGLIGWEDWQLMAWCSQNQHAIFTNNEADWKMNTSGRSTAVKTTPAF